MSAISDPVADFLTRIRNAQKARHPHLDVPASKLKRAITQILLDKGYVKDYVNIEDDKQGIIRVYLKYMRGGKPVIQRIDRVSKPGLRIYKGRHDIPQVMNGLGVTIVSTSRGVMTDRKARANGVGGEVIAYVA